MHRVAVHDLASRVCARGMTLWLAAAVSCFALLPSPVAAQAAAAPQPASAAPLAPAPSAAPSAATGAPQAPAPAAPAASRSKPAPSVAAAASRPAKGASAPKSNGKRVGKPLWRELRPTDQQALAPLATTWDTISYAQKRKWLQVARSFPTLSTEEQTKLHSRMTEWLALSPQQRTEARLNFGATKQLSPDDKKAMWEAYKALPPEEKQKLAAAAAKPPPSTAAAVKPVPAGRLATVPRPKPVDKTPRIAVPSESVERNTLLPRSAPASSPGRSG